MIVYPPYMEHGIRFETTGLTVTVYIEEILSKVSFSAYSKVVMSLDTSHFLNNTEGQCGEHQWDESCQRYSIRGCIDNIYHGL